jgi:hypothetical protein
MLTVESTPVYISPLIYIENKKIIKNHKKIQMNFLDNKTTISYYFGPMSTFWSTLKDTLYVK